MWKSLFAIALVITLVVPESGSASTTDPTRIPWTAPKIPGAVIPCFHGRGLTLHRHPGRCNFGEYRADEINEVSVKNMHWGHWGAGTTRAAFGVDARTGARVRVIAYRRVTCPGGTIWYSKLIVVDLRTGHYSVRRLPACVPAVG
jgi:hypothetical protein